MNNRLESLRMFIPAEVTSSYLAIQGVLAATGIGRSEYMWFMALIVAVLALANIFIYLKIYGVRHIGLQLVLGLGFLIWVCNIDTARFKDFPFLGEHITIAAPVALILYTMMTSFIPRPERADNAAPA